MGTAVKEAKDLTDIERWLAHARLEKDMREAAADLAYHEIQTLVRFYYTYQELRKGSDNVVRSKDKESNIVIDWLSETNRLMELNAQASFLPFTQKYRVGRWLTSITGIEKVNSACLMAWIDIRKFETVSHLWSYAGLNPNQEWKKGEQRPFNMKLKTLLTFKIGECFIRAMNSKGAYYGPQYAIRKKFEWERNLRGYNDQYIKEHIDKLGKSTDAYKYYAGFYGVDGDEPKLLGKDKGQPMLPPGQIHNRARRWAVKLFVSHLYEVFHEDFYGRKPVDPWIINKELDGHQHTHIIRPPGWPVEDGLGLDKLYEK
jgi:hypothetical protein